MDKAQEKEWNQNDMTTMTIRLPKGLKFEFEIAAQFDERSASQQIRQLMKNYIKKTEEWTQKHIHIGQYEEEGAYYAEKEAKAFLKEEEKANAATQKTISQVKKPTFTRSGGKKHGR
jgi:predicted transcriptional regulator